MIAPAGRCDRPGAAEAGVGGIEQHVPAGSGERHVQQARLGSEVQAHEHSLARGVAALHPYDGRVVGARHLRPVGVEVAQRRQLAAQAQELAVEVEHLRVDALAAGLPAQGGAPERLLRLRVERLARPAERAEFLRPAAAHGLDQLGARVAGEEWEGRVVGVLLAHEEQRHLGGEQDRAGHQLGRLDARSLRQPVAEHPVPDLVVVLAEDDESAAVDAGGGRAVAAAAVARRLAGVGEALPVGPRDHPAPVAGEIGVVAAVSRR